MLSRSDLAGLALRHRGPARALHARRGRPHVALGPTARRRTRRAHRVPSRRPDAGRRGQPLPARHLGDEHPRHLHAARGNSRARSSPRGWSSPRPTRPTARTTQLPYREDFALQPSYPVRRLEGGDGPDRPLVRHDVRHAGGGDAARERLRARRRELGARDPGHRAGAHPRRAPGDPLGRDARARLHLRGGRGRRVPRGGRLARATPATTAARGTPARASRTRCSRWSRA